MTPFPDYDSFNAVLYVLTHNDIMLLLYDYADRFKVSALYDCV